MTLEHCSQKCPHMSLCGALLPAPGILRQGSSDFNEVLLLVYVPLEKEMATQNSSILASEILWTEEPSGRPKFNPWVGKIPWRREWLPTPVFLPGEFHGQRSLAGYCPWGCKELDTTEQLILSLSKHKLKMFLSYREWSAKEKKER